MKTWFTIIISIFVLQVRKCSEETYTLLFIKLFRELDIKHGPFENILLIAFKTLLPFFLNSLKNH